MDSFEVPLELGQKITQAMGLDAFKILDPAAQEKYLTVAKYLSRFEDGANIASTVTRRFPAVEKADILFEYVNLRKELDGVRQQMSELPSKDMISSETPEEQERRKQLESSESALIEQISQYE